MVVKRLFFEKKSIYFTVISFFSYLFYCKKKVIIKLAKLDYEESLFKLEKSRKKNFFQFQSPALEQNILMSGVF